MFFTTRRHEDTVRVAGHSRVTVALVSRNPVRRDSEAPQEISLRRVATRSAVDETTEPREHDAPVAR